MGEEGLAIERFDGEYAVLIHHVALGISLLGKRGRAGVDIGHPVFLLHTEHMGMTVDQEVTVLVRG